MSQSEREIRKELLREIHNIRENLDAIRLDVEDIRTRVANLETSRIKRPYA